MTKILYILPFIALAVHAQQNAQRKLSPSLRECYENKYLVQKDNRLPHTLNTFLAILRKIENVEGLNMDLRSLSVALLHRFRQDGIVRNPDIPVQDGVSPYAVHGDQFHRHSQTLRLIPGNAISFPNNSLTDVERCTLHAMLSSSVELIQRGDESTVCRFTNSYRYLRSVQEDDEATSEHIIGDVETLSSGEIETMTKHKSGGGQATIDPSSLYPALPPNHPDNARLGTAPRSKCPVENGVIKTPWGTVSGGPLLAGVAAATQPQTITVSNLQSSLFQINHTSLSGSSLDNKWIATLAGDLAEVALLQAPSYNEDVTVGLNGNWNSTALPRWYFLNANEKYDMTTAEIRGDLDGLILADEVGQWYSKIPGLKLSQILDMYYSRRGFFNSTIRACNRRTLFTYVASNETMVEQTFSAATLLSSYITTATLDSPYIEKFSVYAINKLVTYIPTEMNKDLSCSDTDKLYDFHQTSVDLTIILDTNWDFSAIKPILGTILENIELNQFNSNFTLINGHDGSPMINSTSNILDFYSYNSTHYANITQRGFDLRRSLAELKWYLMHKMDSERTRGVGGARSDVVLIIPYSSIPSTFDKEASLRNISEMRERIPDTTLLIMTHGSKDTWSDLVKNPATDLFSINVGDTEEALAPLTTVVSRIKQVPKRLINTQCGSDYTSFGSSNSYDDYIEPQGVNYYRLHPNYFYNHDNSATIKIRGSGSDNLIVCHSREMFENATSTTKSCETVNSDEYKITVSCADAAYINQCPPLYISVTYNSTAPSYQCTDARVCRFPYLTKYTISYEHLACTSSASKIAFNSLIIIILLSLAVSDTSYIDL